MMGPYRTNEMFSGGNCRLCNWQVRGTANRNRHLDRHVRAGELEEGGNRGFVWSIPDAMPTQVIDLMKLLQDSLAADKRSTPTGRSTSSEETK